MPELPEVETTARGLRARLVGRAIVRADAIDWPRMLPNATPDLLEAALPGERVEGVERRGKYLLLRLGSGATLAIHRKMSGNLVLRPAGSLRERHTHLVLSFDDRAELHFVDPRKFGRVYYFPDSAGLEAFIAARLGPEPLADLTAERLGGLLRGRRGRLKSLLLDQRFLAGVGNLYADEALWRAGLHANRRADGLSPDEVERLAEAIRTVLERAIARRGTSFSSYLDAAGQPGENQDHLLVYGRAGQPCQRCGATIERRIMAQRGTWFCPRCQPAPPPA